MSIYDNPDEYIVKVSAEIAQNTAKGFVQIAWYSMKNFFKKSVPPLIQPMISNVSVSVIRENLLKIQCNVGNLNISRPITLLGVECQISFGFNIVADNISRFAPITLQFADTHDKIPLARTDFSIKKDLAQWEILAIKTVTGEVNLNLSLYFLDQIHGYQTLNTTFKTHII